MVCLYFINVVMCKHITFPGVSNSNIDYAIYLKFCCIRFFQSTVQLVLLVGFLCRTFLFFEGLF